MKNTAALFLTLLLLAGCGVKQGQSDPAPSRTEAGTYSERFTTVVALKDALAEAGYVCPNWVQSDNVVKALQSGSCTDDDILSIYLDSAAVQASIEALKGSGEAVSLTVGENWIVNTPKAEAVSQLIGGTVVTSPATKPSKASSATPTTFSTSESAPPPASAVPPTSAPPINRRPTATRTTLDVGETAHLDHWDVTVLRSEYGKDDISMGWKVQVCYVAPSELERNGRITVSDKPWSAIVQDLEGVEENLMVTIPIHDFERDHTYRPDYLDTTLSLGECNLGWIGIVHGNPDLGWFGIVYEPSTGETVTWLE